MPLCISFLLNTRICMIYQRTHAGLQKRGTPLLSLLQEFTLSSVHVTILLFFFSDDIVIKYENKNTSFLELARQLNIRFGSNFLKGCELQSSRSCKGRCGKWERNETPKCYCDDLCQELGDCCHDYYTRYRNVIFWNRKLY